MPVDIFDCGRTFDELVGRLSKHFRRNMRSHRRKLESMADVRFVTATGADTAAEFETFLDVEASGWKGSDGTGSAIRLPPQLIAFYRRLATTLQVDDRCEINAVYAQGRCLASQFCVVSGEDYTILKIGYDEEYARIAPGLLLLERTLERCCQDPEIRRVSLVTDGPWQRDWRPDKIATSQAFIAIGPWTGRPLVALLRFRFGPGRDIVRWWRRFRERRASDEAL